MATRRSVGYEDRTGRRKVTLVRGPRSLPWNSSRCSSGVNARPGIMSRPSGVLNFASGSGIDWLTTTRVAVASMTKATRNAVHAFTKTPRRVPGGSGWTERRYRSPTQRKAGGFRLSHLVRRRSWNLAVLHMRRSSRHDSGERLRGFTAGSVRTYLSAVWWLSDLISFEDQAGSLDRHATGEPGLHRLQLRRAPPEFLLAVEEFQRLLLDDLHAPLDVLLRLVRFGADLRGLRLRLGQEGPLPVEVLFAGREVLLPSPEFAVPFVDPRFAVPDSLLAIEELDCPPLKELAFPGQLGFLAFHRLPDFLGDFARGAMRGDEAFLRHRSETLAQIGYAALDFAAGLVFFPGPGRSVDPFFLEESERFFRLLFELGDSCRSLLVPSLEIGLRRDERLSLLLKRLSRVGTGFRLRLLRVFVGTRRELFRDFQGLRGSGRSFGNRVLQLGRIVREGRKPRFLPIEFLLASAQVRRVRFELGVQFCEGFFLRLKTCVAFREPFVDIRFRLGGAGRCGAARGGREMRVGRGEQEGGPVHILRRELSAGQKDERELATLKRREYVLAHGQRVAVPDPFVGQDLQEVVVVDRAIRIEDVLAGHFPALVEDVNFLELGPSDLLQRSGHQDSRHDWAEASDYETGE